MRRLRTSNSFFSFPGNRPLTYQTELFKVKRNRLGGREEQTRLLRDDVTVPRRMASRRGGSPLLGMVLDCSRRGRRLSGGGGDGFVSLLSVDLQTNPSIPGFRWRAAHQRLNMRSGDVSSQNHEFVLLVPPKPAAHLPD
ncbi:Hypothetical predicted protein [Xyrichtys novacula]|uniref:Uncharacterized protein n=1 Tax=Xyrichtys novacula TaxID=13765 RepID=A0AAV1FK62_XYRNO|nr:Hypothetical predicted protein [Xyrichtys novacula]